MKTVDEADVAGKRVLLRVDFNVPLAEGTVTDDMRIREALPTIHWLVEQGARVIIMAHLGRPEGCGYEHEYSMMPVARVLSRLLGQEVKLAPDGINRQTRLMAESLKDGEVLLLENLRFDNREKLNDPVFANELAEIGDIFVNDAFGAAHRAHTSLYALPKLLPSYAGYLLAREVQTLRAMLADPARPFVAILGGSKVSDKIAIIDKMLDTVDTLLIGGGMCFTFLAAQGYNTGRSLMEESWVEAAAKMLDKARERGVKLMLPSDVVVAMALSEDAATSVCAVDAIPDDQMGLDIGPATVEAYAREIAHGRTVFWNGPMGVFEMKPFEAGTREVARAVARNKSAVTVIGGGDSAAAMKKFDLTGEVTFISTGGGASMKLLEGAMLPAVEALD